MKKMIREKTEKKNINGFYHFLIALATFALLIVAIHWDAGIFKAEFREGDIALRTIYSPYDFSIKGDINKKATERAREGMTESVLPVYYYDREAEQGMFRKVEDFISAVKNLKAEAALGEAEKTEKVRGLAAEYNLSEALAAETLKLDDPEVLAENVKDILSGLLSEGIISVSERDRLEEAGVEEITLRDKAKKTGGQVTGVGGFLTLDNIRKKIKELSNSVVKKGAKRGVAEDLAGSVIRVNVFFDKESTESRIKTAADKIQPIYNIIEIKKNETILNKGERITKEHLAKLIGMGQNESSFVKMGNVFAIGILIGIFMLLISLYLADYEPELLKGNKELILFSLICILVIIAAKVIVISPWPSNLIPVSVASMLIAILINNRLAIVATFFLSVIMGIISGNNLDITGLSLVGGLVGVFAIRGVRRRSQLIAAGFSVGFINMSYLIGIGLARSLDFSAYITEASFGLVNGLMSAVIVTGILPVFENSFKITTDISLLELSDLNHPLLKEMVIEAPGTYHHSLVVGNLAEAVCEAINANPLLARVGSYFHDIGKIEKAEYFSENQSNKYSVHDKLSPTMSSLIITNHVKNGVELAQKYKLNREIVDIIKQHHGTGLVFYFFKRALEKTSEEEVGEQAFRYTGPKPQTKEAACVLLADSVEAGSRALEDPTPSRIKGLVRKIVNNKFIDGQLDECNLTLKDLEKIATIFTHILTGIYHTRVEYPDDDKKEKK